MLMSRYDPKYNKLKHIWQSPETFATTLLIVFLDQYGAEGLGWTPVVAVMEIEEDFGVELPQVNIDKLMAALLLLQTDSFFNSLPDFITICNVLSGTPASPHMFDPAEPHECAWGITEALLIDPAKDEQPIEDKFSDEIKGYIRQVCKDYGLIVPPDVLRIGFAEDVTSRVNFDYSDDPEMFSAIWGAENIRTKDIDDMLHQRLLNLLNQLREAPLSTGNTDVASKMVAQLKKR